MTFRNTSIVLLLILLIGCAARPPYEELVAEAELTGDWSAVNQYNRMNKSMNRVDGSPACKSGYVLICRTKSELSGQEDCGCVSPQKNSIFND